MFKLNHDSKSDLTQFSGKTTGLAQNRSSVWKILKKKKKNDHLFRSKTNNKK